jgi:hypothetical protein
MHLVCIGILDVCARMGVGGIKGVGFLGVYARARGVETSFILKHSELCIHIFYGILLSLERVVCNTKARWEK